MIRARLKALADGALRSLYAALARPLAITEGPGPCVVLAPHPDDESLGCGDLIAAMRAAGREVRVVFACDGGGCRLAAFRDRTEVIGLRQKEARAACAVLGVPADAVMFLGFPDGSLDARREMLWLQLGEILGELRPASVFAPFIGEQHGDHTALSATARALRMAGAFEGSLYEYPIWLPTRLAARLITDRRFRRKLRTIAGGPAGAAKRAAVAAHASQGTEYEGQRIDGALSEHFLALFLKHGEVYFGSGDEA